MLKIYTTNEASSKVLPGKQKLGYVLDKLVSVIEGNISGFIMVFRSILRSTNLFKTMIKPGM